MEPEAKPAYAIPFSGPVPHFRKYRNVYIGVAVVVLVLLAAVGYLTYQSKGHPFRVISSFVSVLMLPTELRHALFVSSADTGRDAYQPTSTGFRWRGSSIEEPAIQGDHLAVPSGKYGDSEILLDWEIVAASSSLLLAPAINSDATILAWGAIPSRHKVVVFSNEKIVTHETATGKEHIYSGVMPFFTPNGDIGRIVNGGIEVTSLSTGETHVIAPASGVQFSPNDIHISTFVVSPDFAYVGWLTNSGDVVILHVEGAQLVPVLTQKTSAQSIALGTDSFYVVQGTKGNTWVERTSLTTKKVSKYYLPPFFTISSLVL